MIEVERLHPSEFDLLHSIDDGFQPDPEKSIVVVARNESRIIGRIALVAPTHVEAIFVERAWRNSPVFKRLVDAVEMEARAEGIKTLLAYAVNDQMADYISRLGYTKMPLQVYGKEL